MKKFILLFLLSMEAFSMDNNFENVLLPNCVYFCEESGELSLLDSRLAKEKFPDVEWVDVDKSRHHPPLIIKLLDKEFVGYGVFAGCDIAQGDFVVEYEGEVSDEVIDSKYSLEVPIQDYTYCVCSERKGGVARFIQHGTKDLEEYNLMDLKSEEVAVCNLKLASGSKEKKCADFHASKHIKKLEPILFDYGKDYWIHYCKLGDYESRLFSKKNGQLIPKSSYLLKTVTIIVQSLNDENDKNIAVNIREFIQEQCKQYKILLIGPPGSVMKVESASVMDNINRGRSIFWLTEIPSCHACGNIGNGLKKCSRCQKTFYCNKKCQASDWKTHKPNCKQPADQQ